jgi:hypothetical protein
MRRSPLLLTLVLLGSAVAARAATEYTVTRSGTEVHTSQYRVIAEDRRIRVTSMTAEEGPILLDGLLWVEGSPVIALNSQNQTWYELEDPAEFALSSFYLSPMIRPPRITNLKLELEEQTGAAEGERRYSGRLHYLVHGPAGVDVTCDATLDVRTTDTIDRRLWLGHLLPKTRFAEVDERLAAVEKTIRGFPLRLSMTVTRQYAGGDAMTDTSQVEVSGIRQTKPDPASFVRPKDYQHQQPVFGVPGG